MSATAAVGTHVVISRTGSSSSSTTTGAAAVAAEPKKLKHKRRYCRHPGCTSIVKSQGLCQRHGAKPRLCKVEGCKKQAQGNFDGMCKAHFKAHKQSATPLPPPPPPVHIAPVPPPPEGLSVYDSIIPASVAWRPDMGTPMPLIQHLKDGFENPTYSPAWHRNEERRARGLWPVSNPATQLEGWERELVWMEILLLTGNPAASFRHLARAWGRDKGFHMVLAQFICERHGNVERKKRRKGVNSYSDDVYGYDGDANDNDDDDDDDDDTNMDVVAADLNDDTIFGDAAYNEALAADLFTFDAAERQHQAMQEHEEHAGHHQQGEEEGNSRMYSFEYLGEDDDHHGGGGDNEEAVVSSDDHGEDEAYAV